MIYEIPKVIFLSLSINISVDFINKTIDKFYLGKVNYPLYRINNKHILLGSVHINTVDTLKDIVINEIDNSEQFYFENIAKSQDINKIIYKYYKKSQLEKFTELKFEYPESTIGIFISKYLYSSKIINETNKVGIKDIYNNHLFQQEIFGIDRVIEAISIAKNHDKINNKCYELDNIFDDKYQEINNELLKQKYNKSLILQFCEFIAFIPSYILNFFGYEHNFNMTNIEFQLILIYCQLKQYFIDKFNYTDYITNERNNIWIKKIQENLSKDKKIFICVGSAHVFGLVKEFKKEYHVEKYNYWKNKFETI